MLGEDTNDWDLKADLTVSLHLNSDVTQGDRALEGCTLSGTRFDEKIALICICLMQLVYLATKKTEFIQLDFYFKPVLITSYIFFHTELKN